MDSHIHYIYIYTYIIYLYIHLYVDSQEVGHILSLWGGGLSGSSVCRPCEKKQRLVLCLNPEH